MQEAFIDERFDYRRDRGATDSGRLGNLAQARKARAFLAFFAAFLPEHVVQHSHFLKSEPSFVKFCRGDEKRPIYRAQATDEPFDESRCFQALDRCGNRLWVQLRVRSDSLNAGVTRARSPCPAADMDVNSKINGA